MGRKQGGGGEMGVSEVGAQDGKPLGAGPGRQ